MVLGTAGTAGATSVVDHVTSGGVNANAATILAGKDGATYELRGGALVAFSPGAEFAFEPSTHLKIRKPGDPETPARVVRVVRGRAEVTIPASARELTAVLLRGPGKMSAVAKEGVCVFVVGRDQTTAASRQGEMLVGIGNDWKPLHEGMARSLAPDDPAAFPHPILAAPGVVVDPALVLREGDDAPPASVRWSAVKDATSYEITLSRVTGASSDVTSLIVSSGTSASLGVLAPGSYLASVVAIDRRGLPGVASSPRSLRVVGVALPAGTELSRDGAILLGADDRVSLLEAGGLEVSYGGSSVFGGAPGSLGLAHGEATTVRLRARGSSEEALLRFEPKGLRARIDIGPHEARWPVDHVAIRIDLYDASGRAVPDDAPVTPSVTVNLQPIDANWARTGHILRATLPAGTSPGPWVVRAEVRDARGDLIGRNFLEVARSNSGAKTELANRWP